MPMPRLARGWAALLLLAAVVGHARSAPAQDEAAPDDDPATRLERLIETDRNSFTFTPLTVDPGRLITEVSYTYFDITPGAEAKHSFPEFIARYGLTKRLELRFGWNYETGGTENPAVADIANFFGADMTQQMLYGAKLSLTHQKGLQPATAVLVQGHTPTGGPQSISQLRMGYSLGWELPNDWIVDAGFEYGTDRIEDDSFTIWAPSAVVKFPFGREKRWFTHIEYFSVFSVAMEEPFSNHFLDTGLHHLITPNVEVGGILGIGLNDAAPPLIVSLGLGIRF
jgi:hypothetical protein